MWEFQADSNFTDSSAAEWARDRYLSAVTARLKDDSRALENCKKNTNGRPIFEAKGAVYSDCGF